MKKKKKDKFVQKVRLDIWLSKQECLHLSRLFGRLHNEGKGKSLNHAFYELESFFERRSKKFENTG